MSTEKAGKGPLTTGQIAKYCHVTHRGVLKWVESGKLRAYRTPGKHSRVSIEDFINFLKQYNMPIPEVLQSPSTLKKILIVDDDRGIVQSLQRVLMMENKYIVETAYDGFQAGKKFSEFKPDFIILDICMPGLDGYQVCTNLRQDMDNKHVKILAISGLSEPQEIKKIMDLGANDYLQKPFSNEVLQQKINHLFMGCKQMKAAGAHISVRFFKVILVSAGILLVMLVIYDHRAEESVKKLNVRYDQIDHFRNDIIRFNEILTMSARMAAATGDVKWEKRYQEYEPKLTLAIQQAISISPEIYRKETDRSNIRKIKLLDMEHTAFELIRHGQGKTAMDILFGKQYEIQENSYTAAIERLNTLLKQQMEAAMTVLHSKEYLARVSFITVLCLLLLSWLIILRITRRTQEVLVESNRQLSERSRQLDELNQTLEVKVLGRTHHLNRTLAYLEKTHQALKDAQNQLVQSEKFSAIGQLAAGVAHEINNPIGFINSNLQTLQLYVVHYKQLLGILNKLEKALKDKDKERVAEVVLSWEKIRLETNFSFIDGDVSNLLNESIEGAQKIGRIVSDLRTFASPDRGTMDSVNLEVLLESILNIVWNEIKYKAEIKREYGQVPMVLCNPQKMGQVFVNMLINSAQAIKGKGTITIKTYANSESVFVDISDTGCGIAPEHFNRIFDPLFTTKAPGEGVGLGLSLSYDIVKKHAGDLRFNSKLGEGTTFTVMLPLMAPVYESSQL